MAHIVGLSRMNLATDGTRLEDDYAEIPCCLRSIVVELADVILLL